MSNHRVQDPAGSPAPPRARGKRRPHSPPPTLASELVAGDSYTTIAKRHKVDRGTVASWVGLPKVVAEVATLNEELRERTRQKVMAGYGTGIDVLSTIATNKRLPAVVKVKAAEALGRITQPKEPTKVELTTPDGIQVRLAAMTEEELKAIIKEGEG